MAHCGGLIWRNRDDQGLCSRRTDLALESSALVVLLSSNAARLTVKRSCIVASASVKLRSTQQYSSDRPFGSLK